MKKLDSIKQRIKENFKKNKVLLIVFVIVWTVLIIFTLNSYNNTLGKKSSGNESYDRSVIEVNKNTVIKAVVPVENNADGVSILFATYARNANKGNVTVEITGEQTKKEYVKEVLNVKSIEDNAYHTFTLKEPLKIKDEKKINIKITSDSEPSQAIGVYYSNVKWFELDSSFSINNEKLDNTDLMTRFTMYDESFKNFSNAVILWSIIGISIIALVILLLQPKYETIFALIILVLGLIMMIIIVPMSPPDEQTHYEISLKLSNMIMGQDPNLIDSSYLKYGSMYGHYNISAGYSRFMEQFGKAESLRDELVQFNLHDDIPYFADYIPQALGITLGRLLHFNMLTVFYIGRLFNLVFYTVCIYFAIKKASSFKFLLGVLASMPMFVQTSMSFSYDVFIISLSFLLFSYFTRWYFIDKKITIKEYIIVFIISFFLAPAKVIYGLAVFVFWFVPTRRYKNIWQKILLTLLLCAPVIYQLLDIMLEPLLFMIDQIIEGEPIFKIISVDNLNDNTILALAKSSNNYGNIYHEEITYSYDYIANHPIETIEMFARTVRYRIKFWFYGTLGRELSGGTLILPITLVHMLVGIMFASAFMNVKNSFSISLKTINILLCIGIGTMVLVGFFVTWTDHKQVIVDEYGGALVEGIQGRYFNPVLPYFFTIFANKKISIPKKCDKYILLTYLLVFFEIIIYVLSYTFVN